MKLNSIPQKGISHTALDEEDHKMTTKNVQELVPGRYKGVMISITNGKHNMVIPETMDRERYGLWKRSPAGIMSRDLMRMRRGKDSSEWVLVESKDLTTLVRLIKEDELEEFEGLKLIHGKIKDSYFMHLKTVNSEDNVYWTEKYINRAETSAGTEGNDTPEGEDNEISKAPRSGSLFE